MSLIQIKQSTRYPNLYVKKYHKKVFYKNLWNEDPELVESRGHIVNDKGELVVNPFTKVFNYKENGTTIDPHEMCLIVEKINGFMACLTYYPELDEVLVSTTGSLDSTYTDRARDYLSYAINVLQERKEHLTYVFEIVHHNDPHIIEENIGAYLLGVRSPDDTKPYFTSIDDQVRLDITAKMLRVSRPKYFRLCFRSLLNTKLTTCKHEGYMVYGRDSNTVLKLKSPYYLALKAIARKKDIYSLDYKKVDKEYYPLIDYLRKVPDFTELSEQQRLTLMRNFLKEHPHG